MIVMHNIVRYGRFFMTMAVLLAACACSSEHSPSQGTEETVGDEMAPPAQELVGSRQDAVSVPDAFTGETLSEEDLKLLDQLGDPSIAVRMSAAEDIEATGMALNSLATVITTDPSPEVRSAAIYALKESEDPGAVDVLIIGLDNEDPEILLEIIDALWFLEDRRAIPHIQRMLEHPNEEVREAAMFALEDFE